MPLPLDEIIARLEDLDRADHLLDLDIAVAARMVTCSESARTTSYYRITEASWNGTAWPFMTADFGELPDPMLAVATFTDSVDAALALAVHCLPGWYIEHAGDNADGEPGSMKVFGHTVEYSDGFHTIQGDAPTKPLAHCIAVMKAVRDTRSEIAERLVERVAEFEPDVSDRVYADLRAVAANFIGHVSPPDVEADEGTLVLRWSPDPDRSFTLTFMGKGNVTGYLSAGVSKLPAWKRPVSDQCFLIDRLNTAGVAALTRRR